MSEVATETVFRVHRKVWGGITGRREGVMKSNGEPLEFDTREEAQEYADRANRDRMNANHHAWVVEVQQ